MEMTTKTITAALCDWHPQPVRLRDGAAEVLACFLGELRVAAQLIARQTRPRGPPADLARSTTSSAVDCQNSIVLEECIGP